MQACEANRNGLLSESMRQYAELQMESTRQYAELQMESTRQYAELQYLTMRQYADRAMTYTRHPAVFAVRT